MNKSIDVAAVALVGALITPAAHATLVFDMTTPGGTASSASLTFTSGSLSLDATATDQGLAAQVQSNGKGTGVDGLPSGDGNFIQADEVLVLTLSQSSPLHSFRVWFSNVETPDLGQFDVFRDNVLIADSEFTLIENTPGSGTTFAKFLYDGAPGSGTGTTFEFRGDSNAAFRVNEFAVVPLPAALPLFGGALGLLGFLGWRREKQAAA